MSGMYAFLSSLLAEEAVEWALHHTEVPEPADAADLIPGWDMIFSAFRALTMSLGSLPLQEDRMAAIPRDLTDALRQYAIRNAKEAQMVVMSKAAVDVLVKAILPEDMNAHRLSVATITLIPSTLLLQHLHIKTEKCLQALDSFPPEVVSRLRPLVFALEPVTSREVIEMRLERANLPLYIADACCSKGLAALWFSHAFRLPSAMLCATMSMSVADEIRANPSAFAKYAHAALEGPSTWLLLYWMELDDVARGLLFDAAQCDAGDFANWLEAEACRMRDLQSWLANETPRGGGEDFSALIRAISAREAGNEAWFSLWKRCVDFDKPIQSVSFWDHDGCSSAEFETFWRAQGYLEAGLDEMAADVLERALECGMNAGQIWLILAVTCIRLGQYGKAEHAILQAEQNRPQIYVTSWTPGPEWVDAPAEKWNAQVRAVRHSLGESALHRAKASHVVEPSLLEVAIRYGNAQVASEAALCAMDAQCDGLEELLTLCFHNDRAASLFVERIVARREVADYDAMYEVSRIFARECPGDARADALEAMSRSDAPEMAVQSLASAIRRIDSETTLFWECADLWIELQCLLGAFDEAVYGIVQAFGASHPRAPRSLLFLMASISPDARPMLQGALEEALGQDGSIKVLERAKTNPEPNATPEKDPSFAPEEIALWMMPASWQMFYHSSRIDTNPTPLEAARAKRRESVLKARGRRKTEVERPNEPAAWEHREQPYASSSFLRPKR